MPLLLCRVDDVSTALIHIIVGFPTLFFGHSVVFHTNCSGSALNSIVCAVQLWFAADGYTVIVDNGLSRW